MQMGEVERCLSTLIFNGALEHFASSHCAYSCFKGEGVWLVFDCHPLLHDVSSFVCM